MFLKKLHKIVCVHRVMSQSRKWWARVKVLSAFWTTQWNYFVGDNVQVVLFWHWWNCTLGIYPTGTNCVNHHFYASVLQHLQEDVWCNNPEVWHNGDRFLCHRSAHALCALSAQEFQDRIHTPALHILRCVALFLYPRFMPKKTVNMIVMKENVQIAIDASSSYQVAS
jgi:hypothetical protein